jgi:hypothetical protein
VSDLIITEDASPHLSNLVTQPLSLITPHVVLVGREGLVVAVDGKSGNVREMVAYELSDDASRNSLVALRLVPHIMRGVITSPNDHVNIELSINKVLYVLADVFDHVLNGADWHITLALSAPIQGLLGLDRSRVALATATMRLIAEGIRALQVLQVDMQVGQLQHLETKRFKQSETSCCPSWPSY